MKSSILGSLLLIEAVYGQMAFTFMYGQTNGLTGKGYGTMDGTPRNVSTRDPAMLDSAIMRQAENASPCGRTLMSGNLEMNAALEKAEDGGLPDVNPDGKIRIVAHQITKEGGGPYTCGVDVTATGMNFRDVPVSVNVPATNGALTKPTDFSLEADMPQGMKCQGGADGQTCVVRCVNKAPEGPFGGCMAFTQMQGLYNDPAPAGQGPSRNFQLDRITENPVTRDGNVFEDARSKMSAQDLQPPNGTPPNGKAKRRSVMRLRRAVKQSTERLVRKRQNNGNNGAPNGKSNNNGNGNTNTNGNGNGSISTSVNRNSLNTDTRNSNFGPGHINTIMPTEEGIAFEIATAILGQADVPRNVRSSLMGPGR